VMKELHTPTPQDMAQWREGVADMWPELVGTNQELADTLKETRASLEGRSPDGVFRLVRLLFLLSIKC